MKKLYTIRLLLALFHLGLAFRSISGDITSSDIEPPAAVTCLDGNVRDFGCNSVCRRLGLTSSFRQGQCDDFVARLKTKGYKKIFGASEPSLEPILKILDTNCNEEEYVFFLDVLLKFIDKIPEKTRDEKYESEIRDLSQRVISDLKEKDPNYEVDLASCQDGDTSIVGCRSVCRWLALTESTVNGQCEEYVKTLEAKGYKKLKKWKIWGHESSMEPIMKVLTTNCRKEELQYYLAAILQLISRMPEEKKSETYKEELDQLQKQVVTMLEDEAMKGTGELEDDEEPLPQCDTAMHIEAGDVVTWQRGGPDFEEVSEALGNMREEKTQIKAHFSYGRHFDYSTNPFDTTTEDWSNRSLASKTLRVLVVGAKHFGNAFFKVGKAFADAGINTFKGIGDLVLNLVKFMGKGMFWSGERVTSIYANVKQTTPHTDKSIKFTHTEMAVDENVLITAAYPKGVQEYKLCSRWGAPVRKGYVVISRFVGDGTVDAAKYRALAAQRAKMWQPYLRHYSDTVGQWYRTVLGWCLSVARTPGSKDYFQAVTPEAVKEMWEYDSTEEDADQGFWESIKDSFRRGPDSFRTHWTNEDGDKERLKPKAMFCSKFVAAVWSSTIGNPSNDPTATARSRDLKVMLPFNPGACSPWSIVQWIVSKQGRKSWKSCVADMGHAKYNPCDLDNKR